jgi:hypothetical protein
MIDFVLLVASHTPTWVWAVFAALILLGLRQARDHDISPVRLWLAPAVLGPLSLLGAVHAFAPAGELVTLAAWGAGAALGLAANRVLDLPRQVQANADGSFRVGGSIAPLLLFVGVFAIRYVVNVVLAVAPALSHSVPAAIVAALAYGLTTGVLAARARKIWSARRAPATLAPA